MAKNKNIAITLVLAFTIRIILAPFGTLPLDFNTFVAWSHSLAAHGFSNFYSDWSDYFPGYLYILYLLGKISLSVHPTGVIQTLVYKMPAILADIGTGFLIFKLLEKKTKYAVAAAGLYLFNPAVFANSTLWGQVDGLIPFFVLASIYFLEKNLVFSAILLTFGVLVKPQAGFAAPLIAILIWKNQGIKSSLVFLFFSFLVFLLAFLPFFQGTDFVNFVLGRFSLSANQYPYSSVNAFNLWAIYPGFWQKDNGLSPLSWALTAAAFLFALTQVLKKKDSNFTIPLAIIFLASFSLLTRIHERHLLPVFAPLAMALAELPGLVPFYLLLSFLYLVNLYYSFIWITDDFRQVFPNNLIYIFSFLNLFALATLLLANLKPEIFKRNLFSFSQKVSEEPEKLVLWKPARILLGAILGFSFLTHIAFLWYPKTFYFDEVYHAFTAGEIVNGNPQAWEYWASPPKGFAYEWTHPPLAKLFMAGSMLLGGQTQFFWRIPGALIGIGAVYLVYLLGLQIFKRQQPAVFAAAIFALDGMGVVLSRVGMNDIYFLFFALLGILLFLKEKHLLASFAIGLALASKWTTFYIFPIFLVGWVLYSRKVKARYLFYFLIPPIIYFLSYLPFFMQGHTLLQWWETQEQMWWYHTQLRATHPFSSPWWSWPLMLKPVWLFVENEGKTVHNIYISGNPVVFYGSIAAIIYSTVSLFKKFSRGTLFLLVSYFGFFLPWAFSPRIMFLYHYFPSVPFMCLLLAGFLYKFWENERKVIVLGFFALVIIGFILYFPLWTGLPTPENYSRLFI